MAPPRAEGLAHECEVVFSGAFGTVGLLDGVSDQSGEGSSGTRRGTVERTSFLIGERDLGSLYDVILHHKANRSHGQELACRYQRSPLTSLSAAWMCRAMRRRSQLGPTFAVGPPRLPAAGARKARSAATGGRRRCQSQGATRRLRRRRPARSAGATPLARTATGPRVGRSRFPRAPWAR